MASQLISYGRYPLKGGGGPFVVGKTAVTFGSASIASQVTDCGLVLTRTGVGTYTLVYPVCKDIQLDFQALSAALTITGAVLTAVSATSGTATIKTVGGAGVATEPASGNVLSIILNGRC